MKELIINPATDLVFDVKVREMCRSCKRYGKKATCPPHIPSGDYYRQLLPRYHKGILYTAVFEVGDEVVASGKSSSITIHNKVLDARLQLFNGGHYFVTGFGAGSCKLCEKCTIPCPRPESSLVPLEATGLNVVETMRRLGVDISFPVNSRFYRIGGIFYD